MPLTSYPQTDAESVCKSFQLLDCYSVLHPLIKTHRLILPSISITSEGIRLREVLVTSPSLTASRFWLQTFLLSEPKCAIGIFLRATFAAVGNTPSNVVVVGG